MGTDAQVPGVKNKAVKIVVLVAAGVVVGTLSYNLLDKFVLKKFNVL